MLNVKTLLFKLIFFSLIFFNRWNFILKKYENHDEFVWRSNQVYIECTFAKRVNSLLNQNTQRRRRKNEDDSETKLNEMEAFA